MRRRRRKRMKMRRVAYYLEVLAEGGDAGVFVAHGLAVGQVQFVGLRPQQQCVGPLLKVGRKPELNLIEEKRLPSRDVSGKTGKI
jgi:hypothetical protein